MWKIGNLEVEVGERKEGRLQFPEIEETLPVVLIHGVRPGPTILVLAGIHGCEYTSMDAALEISKQLRPDDVKGRVAVLPIANPAAFYARSVYVHPRDGKNLNRVFPGNREGSNAERLAYWIYETVMQPMDAILDLHGGDMIEALIPFTLYQVSNSEELTSRSQTMASLFGINYVIRSTGQVPGSTYWAGTQAGKAAVIAEAGQQGILDTNQSRRLQQGTFNVLRFLGSLDGAVEHMECQVMELFAWYRAEQSGLWYPNVKIGETVEPGQLLGFIADEFKNPVQEYYATESGIVLFLVTSLAMNQGDPLLAIGA